MLMKRYTFFGGRGGGGWRSMSRKRVMTQRKYSPVVACIPNRGP